MFILLACGLAGGVRDVQGRVFTHSLYQRVYPDGLTCDHRVVLDLTGEWKSDAERSFRVPFSSDVHDELVLVKEFFLPEAPTDSLLLYFEGLAQRSEISDEPFEPLLRR